VKKIVLGLILLFAMIRVLQAQQNDTIYLFNGDRITGELKKFEYGLLFLKTDGMETVNIKFDRIYTMYSTKQFEFRTNTGQRYFGILLNSVVPGKISIVTSNDTVTVALWNVVQITSLKNKFLQKIDGSADLGLSFTKASDVFQYNLSATATYRTANYSTKFDLSSILSEADKEVSKNNDAGLNVTRFLPGKWFANIEIKGQQNTELDLEYRFQAGLGGGYDLVRTNSQRLYGLAGFVGNQEKTIDSALVSDNFEFLASMQYKWFRYSHPKIDVTTGFNLYPSFTTSGRIRFEYDLTAKIEILKDVFFSVTFYENIDNNPSSKSSSKNDWGVITSIGYSF
jgi:hypothetical protein